ncbi:MAG: stage V sporulation protein AB [Cellulosilyticaceae bacterium]
MGRVVGVLLSIFWGLSTGGVIATGVVAFLTIIGIIPRLANKANITKHYYAFGTTVILGTLVGSIIYIWEPYIPTPKTIIVIFAFAFGIFVSCLAVELAEMLDVIPVLKRRTKVKKGLYLFLIAFAFGKVVGSLFYWFYPGFLKV